MYIADPDKHSCFFISDRTGAASNHRLLDDVECSVLVTINFKHPAMRNTLSDKARTLIELPSIEQVLNMEQLNYPFDRKFESVRHETALLVHILGSTGMPCAYTTNNI